MSKETESAEPKQKKKPEWVRAKPADLEKTILSLYAEGHDAAKIGLILRDQHCIPKAKLFGKRITKIIREANTELRNDKPKIEQRVDILKKHLEENIHDTPAKKRLVKELWDLKQFTA